MDSAMSRFLPILLVAFALPACGPDPEPEINGAESGTHSGSGLSPTGGALTEDPIPYRAKGSKPAIDKPDFRDGADVPYPDGMTVIGVVINGEAKAYPLMILNQHQVVNDWVGGVPVAPSW
ncbi:MAG: hypothetical protein CMJ83_05000 [Planctomycetes bacterium]|nr:hypothetical protein [Planctomycetota bacterium]